MKKLQLLGAILTRLIPALIILSPTVFADESVNERQMSQNVVNANSKQWTIPSISKRWGTPQRSSHWTIPPISKQWGIPQKSSHWTIPRSASSLKSPSKSSYSSEAKGWTPER